MSNISCIAISYKKATINQMESIWKYNVEDLLLKLYNYNSINECLILKTCNRIELYIVSESKKDLLIEIAKKLNFSSDITDFYDKEDTISHLMRLSCGLESMIIGEDQILGQIKYFYLLAKKLKTIGPILSLVFHKIIQVGKRARTETKINKGSVSIGSAAVDLAEKYLIDLKGKIILIIGVGEIGILVAKALSDRELDGIYISNRTFEKAKKIADELGGKAIKFESLNNYLKIADVVISATSAPHYILFKKDIENIMKYRKNKKLFIIDIANPRDIEDSVSTIENVTLCNIDNLKVLSLKTLETRKEEAKKVQKIISEEIILLKRSIEEQKVNTIISKLYQKYEILRNDEEKKAIEKLSSKYNICINDKKIIHNLTHSLMNKMLFIPTKKLRESSNNENYLNIVSNLFDLEEIK